MNITLFAISCLFFSLSDGLLYVRDLTECARYFGYFAKHDGYARSVVKSIFMDIVRDDLPKLVTKFGAIEDQVKKVVTSVDKVVTVAATLTNKVKANSSLLLRQPEKESNDAGRK